jgi:soluble lytic murein transglycosylase-like protein
MPNSPTLFPVACVLMLLGGAVAADVYKYRDARGHILLTDKPMRGMTLLKRYSLTTGRSSRPAAGGVMAAMRQRQRDLDPLIARAAREQNLRPELVHAVIRAESAYRSDAISSKGAVGLMQLMPATAERFGVTDRRDPAQNLRGGTTYLRELLVMFDNDLQLALAAYNAGENAVIRHGRKIPPYAETREYVRRVIAFYQANQADDRIALR